jgi:hypothetical protein
MATAAEVIRQHALLTDRWRKPSQVLANYVTSFVQDVSGNRGHASAASMFYPMASARDPEPWLRLIGRGLFTARTYQITAEMCHVTTQLYRKTDREVTRVSFSELPAESGFVWLDEPFMPRDRRGKVAAVRAMSWEVITADYANHTALPAIRFIVWADTRIDDDYTSDWQPGILKKSEKILGRLQLQHVMVIALDRDFAASDDESPLADNITAWFHALLMLLGTEITVSRRASLPKIILDDIRKLVKRPEVSVVTLRRSMKAASGEESGTRHVDWSFRWLVQGHHRHLESYDIVKHHATPLPDNRGRCAVCRGKITWVRPFIKGPDDAPVKDASVVYRLSR